MMGVVKTVELRLEDRITCHRCGGELILQARVPRPARDGDPFQGTYNTVGLCTVCDRDDPAAQGILAFFTVHPEITDTTTHTAAALIDEWANRMSARTIKPSDADADHARRQDDEDFLRWENGEY